MPIKRVVPVSDIDIAFGRALRRTRRRADFTQDYIAIRANVTRSYVSRLEHAVSQPSLGMFISVAGALGMSPITLLAETLWELARVNDSPRGGFAPRTLNNDGVD